MSGLLDTTSVTKHWELLTIDQWVTVNFKPWIILQDFYGVIIVHHWVMLNWYRLILEISFNLIFDSAEFANVLLQ